MDKKHIEIIEEARKDRHRVNAVRMAVGSAPNDTTHRDYAWMGISIVFTAFLILVMGIPAPALFFSQSIDRHRRSNARYD